MKALKSYKFLVGVSQWKLQRKLRRPSFSRVFLIGTKHYLCFRALSPSKVDVYTKHSPFSAEDVNTTISAGKCSPS